MPAAKCYVGAVEGERVCHLAMSSIWCGAGIEGRACRLVVKPEWQGAGVGLRFLNWLCQQQLEGSDAARLPGRNLTTLFHTSHPGLAAALRRDRAWRQTRAQLFGDNKMKSASSISAADRQVHPSPRRLWRAFSGGAGVPLCRRRKVAAAALTDAAGIDQRPHEPIEIGAAEVLAHRRESSSPGAPAGVRLSDRGDRLGDPHGGEQSVALLAGHPGHGRLIRLRGERAATSWSR